MFKRDSSPTVQNDITVIQSNCQNSLVIHNNYRINFARINHSVNSSYFPTSILFITHFSFIFLTDIFTGLTAAMPPCATS